MADLPMSNADDESSYHYDVALSFAGSDREYVEQVADALKAHDLSIFYDRDQQAALWGEDLVELLDAVYRQQSRYVVIFISQAYGEREWTRHERRSAMARALLERRSFVLPARFDDTELPGLRPTVGYLDLRPLQPKDVADLIRQKLQTAEPSPAPDEEVNEFTLFAAELEAGLAHLAPKIADFRMGYASPNDTHLANKDQVAHFTQQRLAAVMPIVNNLERVLAPEHQLRAFGPPGEPGDEATIRHIAASLTRMVEAMLDWALDIRGTSSPEAAQPALWALSRYAEPVVEEHERFVRGYREQIEVLLAAVEADPESEVRLEIRYAPEIPDSMTSEFQRALRRYKRSR